MFSSRRLGGQAAHGVRQRLLVGFIRGKFLFSIEVLGE